MTSNSPFWNEDLMKTMKAISNATKLMGESVATFYSYIDENREIIANIMDSVQKTGKVLASVVEHIYSPANIDTIKGMSSAFLSAQKFLEDYSFLVGDLKTVSLGSLAETLSTLAIETTDYSDIIKNFDIDEARELINSGAITQEEIKAEIDEITANPKEKLSLFEKLDDFKKTKMYIALLAIWFVVKLLAAPIIDEVKDNFYEVTGIQQFYEDAGVMDFIESIFDLNTSYAVSEEEAKATVDKSQTGNISKQNREDLLGKIKEIRTYIASAPQDENTGNLLRYLSEIEKDVNGQKYGLVFEEHREDIDVVLDTHTPVLTEQEELFIENGGQMNFLVEGDNLASLKLLEKTHKGKIDVIYIDPPYNTKNKDFIYDDIFIDNVDGFRHSKWVSFIQPRLKLAKSLLTQGGVIFISIDDNEQAALKMLCDNIFGEHNFVSQLVWEKKKKGSFLSDSITNIKEYILVYTNNKLAFKGLIGEVNDNTETYPCINAVNKREVRKIPKGIKSNYKEKNHFLPAGTIISDTTMNIIFLTDLIIKDNVLAEDVEIEGNWRYSQDAMWEYGLKGEIYITRDLYLRRIVSQARHKMMKDLLPRVGNDTELTYNSLIDINDLFASGWGSNEDADEELRLILGKQKLFDYPKPTRLLTKLLLATRKPNAVCLDFFAGSGTFGHAVMSSNLLDNGIRKFILCTNNENNICRDITYERIKRVIDKENFKASLKYFKVEYVPIDEQMYYEYADELLCHVKELVELENGINFTENAEIGIVLTDEELFNFFENIDEFSKCKKLYIGHDLLLDEEQEAIVSKNGIQVIIIPDYYYRDLQEG